MQFRGEEHISDYLKPMIGGNGAFSQRESDFYNHSVERAKIMCGWKIGEALIKEYPPLTDRIEHGDKYSLEVVAFKKSDWVKLEYEIMTKGSPELQNIFREFTQTH